MQTTLQLSVWLQSYKQSIDVENNIKQKNLDPFFANISKTILPTSDSFPLIMLHIQKPRFNILFNSQFNSLIIEPVSQTHLTLNTR